MLPLVPGSPQTTGAVGIATGIAGWRDRLGVLSMSSCCDSGRRFAGSALGRTGMRLRAPKSMYQIPSSASHDREEFSGIGARCGQLVPCRRRRRVRAEEILPATAIRIGKQIADQSE